MAILEDILHAQRQAPEMFQQPQGQSYFDPIAPGGPQPAGGGTNFFQPMTPGATPPSGPAFAPSRRSSGAPIQAGPPAGAPGGAPASGGYHKGSPFPVLGHDEIPGIGGAPARDIAEESKPLELEDVLGLGQTPEYQAAKQMANTEMMNALRGMSSPPDKHLSPWEALAVIMNPQLAGSIMGQKQGARQAEQQNRLAKIGILQSYLAANKPPGIGEIARAMYYQQGGRQGSQSTYMRPGIHQGPGGPYVVPDPTTEKSAIEKAFPQGTSSYGRMALMAGEVPWYAPEGEGRDQMERIASFMKNQPTEEYLEWLEKESVKLYMRLGNDEDFGRHVRRQLGLAAGTPPTQDQIFGYIKGNIDRAQRYAADQGMTPQPDPATPPPAAPDNAAAYRQAFPGAARLAPAEAGPVVREDRVMGDETPADAQLSADEIEALMDRQRPAGASPADINQAYQYLLDEYGEEIDKMQPAEQMLMLEKWFPEIFE